MGNRLTVIQHHPVEGPGEIGIWAGQRGIVLDIHRADLGELPLELDRPCVVLGGPCSINSAPDWLQRERIWLRERIRIDNPIMGICLGSQLLADAMGGDIVALDRPEHGWTTITFADARGTDDGRLDVLQWHHETFTLPPHAHSMASSAICRQQMFRIGKRHVGMQFHPEWNAELVDVLNAHFGVESPLPRAHDAERHQRVMTWFHQCLDAWWGVID